MGFMALPARLREISTRWDVPDARWWQRHDFGGTVVVWLFVLAVVSYSLVIGHASYFVFTVSWLAIFTTFLTWRRARVRRRQPPQQADTDQAGGDVRRNSLRE